MMKITIKLVVFISIMILISCEEPTESTSPDIIPPSVQILFPQDGSIVAEIIKVSCLCSDNVGIKKVELWIDGELDADLVDTEQPYSFYWNTTSQVDSSIHSLNARAYDESDNVAESNTIYVTVDNRESAPSAVSIVDISYTIDEMTIAWNKSTALDFSHYELYKSLSINSTKDLLTSIYNVKDTIFALTDFNPRYESWYWVMVYDTLEYSKLGSGYLVIDSKPDISSIDSIIFENNSFYISWERNNEADFESYSLYESLSQDFIDSILIYTTENINSTSATVPADSNDEKYYKLIVKDYWGLTSTSPIAYASAVDYYNIEKIVFQADYSGSFDIYIINVDGSDMHQLTSSFNDDRNARISPDKSTIVFMRQSRPYLMNMDGSNIREINMLPGSNISFCDWSPNGDKLVVSANVDGDPDIYIHNLENDNTTQIVSNDFIDWYPDWSPAGNSIVFYSNFGDSATFRAYLINLDGSNLRLLTNNVGIEEKVSRFSPDGDEIVITARNYYGEWGLFLAYSDGTGFSELLNTEGVDEHHPSWSPDGTQILFHRKDNYSSNGHGVYSIDIETKVLNMIVDTQYNEKYPHWR